jgi:hypothetical protein
MRRTLPILALWAGLAACLSVITTRVVDWFAMPNELLNERRAISVAETLSPLPRVRDEVVSTFDQLYPVLVAPAFRWGGVPDDLWAAHLLNAWIMSSACIPAFLLARRVTARRWAPYVVALLSVAMPWIFFSSLVFTEVAAYPAFVWAMLAMQASTAAPSLRTDLLALVAIALAFFGRTQLAIMLFLLPAAIIAAELGRTRGLRAALRASLASHPLPAAVYGLLVTIGAVLAVTGSLPGVLGVYGATIGGTGASVAERIVPGGFGGSFVEHLAVFSLGLGILPFVAGVAWLLANLVRPAESRELHTFACLGALTVVAIFLEVTVFDLRFGERFVHDRYLFYLVPIVVLGFVCAVTDPRPPRWSLALPTALVALGFAVGELPRFTWEEYPQVNSDGPIYALIRPIVDMSGSLATARGALVVATVVLSTLFVQASILLRPTLFAVVAVGFAVVALPSLTGYMLARFFEVNGWSGRPLTYRQEPLFDWVDRTVGDGGRVAIVPYPVSTSYFVNQLVWRDYEFWNKSVVHDIQAREQTFRFTGDAFTKTYPAFDRTTGRSDVSPAPFVLQANQETRFRVAGPVRAMQPDTMLIEAGDAWRLDWLTSGLYADGWTRPGESARVRVYAVPGQRGPVTRTLTLAFRAPEGVPERGVAARSNLGTWRGRATSETVRATVPVCVPARGFAEVRVRADGSSPIPGDLRDIGLLSAERDGGVFVGGIALADEIGGPCRTSSR